MDDQKLSRLRQAARNLTLKAYAAAADREAGKEFTQDYVTGFSASWRSILADHPTPITQMLEIGSYEGRSALFWLEAVPAARLTCIDLFKSADRESRFDRNLASHGARLEKRKGSSARALGELLEERRSFDFIYIDGGHERDVVMVDCLLAWSLLRSGGLMLLDDYLWETQLPAALRPQPAIDAFLEWHPEAIVVHRGYQLAARKA